MAVLMKPPPLLKRRTTRILFLGALTVAARIFVTKEMKERSKMSSILVHFYQIVLGTTQTDFDQTTDR
jgi:hypothetical protein